MTNKPVGISYSGGASSRWMIDSLLNGAIDRPEHVAVFFADTGDEHEWTYEDVAATEERCRANKAIARADVKWQTLDFPAIRLGRNRAAQRADIANYGLKAPRFSMCRKCPFKSPERWAQTTEADIDGAFAYDEAIRHGLEGCAVENPAFLTDRLIPIEQLIRKGDPQPSLPGFGPPGCDGGACFL